MTSLCCHLSAQEIANWVTTADGCVHTDDTTKLSPTSCEFVFTSPTRQNSFLMSPVCIGHKAHKPQTFCLANPGSMTKTTPSMVSDVSAIFVETTTLRPIAPLGRFGGAGSKILCCRFGGNVEYRGIHFISPTSGPRLSTSLCILLQASSISYRMYTACCSCTPNKTYTQIQCIAQVQKT